MVVEIGTETGVTPRAADAGAPVRANGNAPVLPSATSYDVSAPHPLQRP